MMCSPGGTAVRDAACRELFLGVFRMLKIEKVDGTLPSFQPQDLEAAADQLPVRDDLLLMPTLVFIMPFTHQHIRTIAIDAEVGPYATTQSTKAISRNLGARISLFRIQVNETRRLVHAQMGLHGHPQRIIPYFATFFFPLSSNKKRDTIWIAGHYLQDLTIIGPHVVRAQFQTAGKGSFSVTLSSSTLPDARRLSQLQEYAAEVTRQMQPVLREVYGPVYNGAQFSKPLPSNYARLNLNGDPLNTASPIDPVHEALTQIWPKIIASLKDQGSLIDYSDLYTNVSERLRGYR